MKVFGVVKKAPAVARNVGGNQGGGTGGGSGSLGNGADAGTGDGTSSGNNDIATDSDTGAFFGPELATPEETAREKSFQDMKDKHAKQLASATTNEERAALAQQHAAELEQEQRKAKQAGMAATMKKRRAAKLGDKKINLPRVRSFRPPHAMVAEYIARKLATPAGQDTVEDFGETTLKRGQIFQPARKSAADIKVGVDRIQTKIDELDESLDIDNVRTRKEFMEGRLELLSSPEVMKYIGHIERSPQPILYGGYPEQTKYLRRDIGEDTLALYKQIPGAVREVGDDYVTLDPFIIKKEIDKAKAAISPLDEKIRRVKQRRDELLRQKANYNRLLEPESKQEVTESKEEGAEPKQKSTEKTSIRQ